MTPHLRNESIEPVVVTIKDDQPKMDILERTNFVTPISSLIIAIGVAFGLFLDAFLGNNEKERQENLEESDEIIQGYQFLRLLPWKWMADRMADFAKDGSDVESVHKNIERYMQFYDITSLDRCEKTNVSDYATFEEFFTRKYKREYLEQQFSLNPPLPDIPKELRFSAKRPIHPNMSKLFSDMVRPSPSSDPLLSPIEGTLVSFQKISTDLHKEYVKGEWYSAKQFLGFNPFEEAKRIRDDRIKLVEETLGTKITQVPKKDMYMCVLYLAPYNYHRYHSPVDWTPHKRIYHSGASLPVAPKSFFQFFTLRSLLAGNHRAVLTGEWKHGLFSFIPVGATNVSSIHLKGEPEFNNFEVREGEEEVNYSGVHYKTGDEIGHFSLGSTVVLVFEYDADGSVLVAPGEKIELGTPLLCKREL